ncbi:MAG: transporter substrate-binding domain-containing protein [Treponemataceae bacterium]|nr:transporter substrate-binding domain-containing protein [Treponemataceae bacterium]
MSAIMRKNKSKVSRSLSRPGQIHKKLFSTMLFLLLLIPLHANLRLHKLVLYYNDARNNTVSKEVASLLEERTGVKINKFAMVAQLLQPSESIISEEEGETLSPEDFVYTLPYLTDETVLITRPGEDIEIKNEINKGNSHRIYAGYKNDDIFRSWLKASDFNNIHEESKTLEDALELIISCEADFTILPSQMAQWVIKEAYLNYLLTTSRTLFPIEYRIPIEKDDAQTLVKINDEILKMKEDGTLLNIYYKLGVKSNILIEEETKLYKPVLGTILLMIMCVLSIVYFIHFFTNYKKSEKVIKKEKISDDELFSKSINDKISMLTKKNTMLTEQIKENKSKDPYTGLYNLDYLRQCINDSFKLYAKQGSPFCIAIIDTFRRNDSLSESLSTMKEEISRLKKKGEARIIAVHNGFGVFYILFPEKKQDQALQIIKKAECNFQNFSLLEYRGQDQYEFLGGVGIW